MIKCHMCGAQVPESEDICPFCGNSVDTKIYCPKCDSSNIEILTEEKKVGWFREVLLTYVVGLLGTLLIKDAVEGKTVVKGVCKDCGKKFKLD